MAKKTTKPQIELPYKEVLVAITEEGWEPTYEAKEGVVNTQQLILLEASDIKDEQLLLEDFNLKLWKKEVPCVIAASTISNFKNICKKVSAFNTPEDLLNSVKRRINSSAHLEFPSKNYAWAIGEALGRMEFNESQKKWLLIAIKSLLNHGAIHPKLKYVFCDVDMTPAASESQAPEQLTLE